MGILSLLSASDRSPAARRRRHTFTPDLGLGVEKLESRVVMASKVAAVVAPPVDVNVGNILDRLNLDNIVVQDVNLVGLVRDATTGVVTATGGTVTGLVGNMPFTADITKFVLTPAAGNPAPGQTCAILDLELGPINLNLLGLHVDTSPICLRISAIEGGGALGSLLCDITDGVQLPAVLNSSPLMTDALSQIATGALAQAKPGQGGGDSVCTGECEILELVVGPLNLNLLGLNVRLDDCNGGPVQVCVSASRGEGLLGNLLCGLTKPNGNRFGLLKSLDRLLDRLA